MYQPQQVTNDLAGIPLGGYANDQLVAQLMKIMVPPGTIIDFAGTVAPYGYLVCPITQTNISRTAYSDLFAAIGTTWGVGDGSSTFGMPWFLADQVGLQANGNVGTASVGAVISHTHTYNDAYSNTGASSQASGGTTNAGTSQTAATGGTYNTAAGARVLKCVKY